MGKLCNWSIELASEFAPDGFILENPRHTKLIEQPFLTNVAYDHCLYCQYDFPYQEDTILWQSDSIKLSLYCCNCKGSHAVKLGGDYGGTTGCKSFSKKSAKGMLPPDLVRSIANQIMKQ